MARNRGSDGEQDADMQVGARQQLRQPRRRFEQRRLRKAGAGLAHVAVQRLADQQHADEVQQQRAQHLVHAALEPDDRGERRPGSPPSAPATSAARMRRNGGNAGK